MDIMFKDDNGIPVTLNTSKITFICTGSFSELREENDIDDRPLTQDDLREAGFEDDMVGRLMNILKLRDYSIDDYIKILKTSKNSPLQDIYKLIRVYGERSIIYTEHLYKLIAEEAYRRDVGVRGLQSVCYELNKKIIHDITFNGNYDDTIILDNYFDDGNRER